MPGIKGMKYHSFGKVIFFKSKTYDAYDCYIFDT